LLSEAAYQRQVVAAAGGVLATFPPASAFTDYQAELPNARVSTAAALHAALAGVSVLIDTTDPVSEYDGSPNDYTMATFMSLFNFSDADAAPGSAFPFLQRGAIFRLDRQVSAGTYGHVGWDFYEGGASGVAALARDFALALHPSAAGALGGSASRWLRNLGSDERVEVLTSASCTDARVAPACGGTSQVFTLHSLNLSTFSPSALAAAVTAALPAGAVRGMRVVDYPMAGILTLTSAPGGPALAWPGRRGAADLFSALSVKSSFSFAPAAAVPAAAVGRRRLAQAAPQVLPFTISGLGGGAFGAARAVEAMALLGNSRALLAAVTSAGVTGAATATASAVTVSATVSLTASAPVAADVLLGQLAGEPFVTSEPPVRSGAARSAAVSASAAAAIALLAVLLF
jgi:hypothetical protein